MAHSLDGTADRTDAGEVVRLMDELVSEIGATKVPPEIHGLALKLQELLDERSAEREMPALS
jgi:hypothetical protein